MPAKKKRLTQREKTARAEAKKRLQAEGILPPDKPRLNRKKFAAEVVPEFEAMDYYTAMTRLSTAINCRVGEKMSKVSAEQVGVLKLLKIAVETEKFEAELAKEGRSRYSVKEYAEKVVIPILNL